MVIFPYYQTEKNVSKSFIHFFPWPKNERHEKNPYRGSTGDFFFKMSANYLHFKFAVKKERNHVFISMMCCPKKLTRVYCPRQFFMELCFMTGREKCLFMKNQG